MKNTSKSALNDLRVIDLSTVAAAPSLGQTLGDHGADVIKIEPPAGDETRRMGPLKGATNPQFIGMNRNKRGIALDLSKDAGQQILLKLLEGADVLIDNFKTGTMEKWGIGYQAVLAERFPQLIHCRITGFGANGPLGGLPGYDGIGQAFGGLTGLNGEANGEAIRIPTPQADLVTGLYATIGLLAALEERSHSGRGQLVEVSLMDSSISLLYPYATDWFYGDKKVQPRMGSENPTQSPHTVIKTVTGYIFMGHFNDEQLNACCKILNNAALADDKKFSTENSRILNRQAFINELKRLLENKNHIKIAEQLLAAGVPAGAALTAPETFNHPQIKDQNLLLEGENNFKAIGIPVKLSRTPGQLRRLPPDFGEHNTQVLSEAGYTAADIQLLQKNKILFGKNNTNTHTANQSHPPTPPNKVTVKTTESNSSLAGLRIIDLSLHLSGTWGTQILGDLGADVIKVESEQGDPTRTEGIPLDSEMSSHFVALNRNKRSLCLDLQQIKHRNELLKQIEQADVLIENFPKGMMEELGLGYETTLKNRFPQLIYCRITAFGDTGPLANGPLDEGVGQAMSSLMSINGAPAGAPLKIPDPISSTSTGMVAASGILLALHERHQSGLGQKVECSQLSATITMQNPFGPDWLNAGVAPRRLGNKHPNAVPYDFYKTQKGTMMLLVANDRQFERLCQVLGIPEVADDPRFTHSVSRIQHPDEVGAIIEKQLATQDSEEIIMKLLRAGVPAAPISSVSEALEHPQTDARQMVLNIPGGATYLGFPIKMSRTPAQIYRKPPMVGQHTKEILDNL